MERIYTNIFLSLVVISNDNAATIYIYQYAKVVLLNGNYFLCLHYLHSTIYSLFS